MGWWLFPVLALAAFRPTHAGETTCDGVCGRRPMASSHNLLRVVGGSNVLPGTWPWMVSFQVLTREGFSSFCGGSLISPRWVLSAAHCFQKPKEIPWVRLSIGAISISNPGPNAQRRSIKRLVNHKLYKHDSYGKVHNDVSLVELNEPVNCTDYIQPACLPDDSVEVSLLSHCYVSGFGIMDPKTGNMPDIMQEGSVDLIPKATCSRRDWWSSKILKENICVGRLEGGVATCKGDSGGPLMCREKRSERYWVVGVTSWGPSSCGQAKKPGVFTSTQLYLDWIRKTTKEDFSLPSHQPPMAQPRPTPQPRPPLRPQPQPEQNGNVPYPRPPPATWYTTRARLPPKTTPQSPPALWYTTRPKSRRTRWPKRGGPRSNMSPGKGPMGPGALTPPQRPAWDLTPPLWSTRPVRWRLRTRAPAWHRQIGTPPPRIEFQALKPLPDQVAVPPGSQLSYKCKCSLAQPQEE
ncbi:acrosin-like [Lacerta agilis]|uniref:acrosin-like n=1 Tax=Lacerta agilis TaxID=80427 RepID=UPI001419FBE1|nr:acrosin-like [Lacerta agilis]